MLKEEISKNSHLRTIGKMRLKLKMTSCLKEDILKLSALSLSCAMLMSSWERKSSELTTVKTWPRLWLTKPLTNVSIWLEAFLWVFFNQRRSILFQVFLKAIKTTSKKWEMESSTKYTSVLRNHSGETEKDTSTLWARPKIANILVLLWCLKREDISFVFSFQPTLAWRLAEWAMRKSWSILRISWGSSRLSRKRSRSESSEWQDGTKTSMRWVLIPLSG